MRKLKLQVQMTIDGLISGTNGEMDWMTFPWTTDINDYVTAITEPVDTIVLGKNLATGFIPHWTAVASSLDNPEYKAGLKFTETPKIVFTKKLKASEWDNTTLATGPLATEINALKNKQGGDIIAYGGAQFVSALLREKLIDELHLFINPVILGTGLPVFREVSSLQNYELIQANHFECGIIVLCYKLC